MSRRGPVNDQTKDLVTILTKSEKKDLAYIITKYYEQSPQSTKNIECIGQKHVKLNKIKSPYDQTKGPKKQHEAQFGPLGPSGFKNALLYHSFRPSKKQKHH